MLQIGKFYFWGVRFTLHKLIGMDISKLAIEKGKRTMYERKERKQPSNNCPASSHIAGALYVYKVGADLVGSWFF